MSGDAPPGDRPRLRVADAGFVSDHLLVGGDLDTRSVDLALDQLDELLAVGLTHVVDCRIEWDDADFVAERAPAVAYLHHGMDDAGQHVPDAWFDTAVDWTLQALDQGGTVLAHCHMGINRGPSLGFAVLLAQGVDPVDALDLIRAARPVAFVAYADDALRWHHTRRGTEERLRDDLDRVFHWRSTHHLDLADVIRRKRAQGW